MKHKSFAPIAAALAISSMFAPQSRSADGAAEQCSTFLRAQKFTEAQPHCEAAAAQSPEGKVLHGDLLAFQGDGKGAVARYAEVIQGHDRANPGPVVLAALQRRARVNFQMGSHDAASEDAHAFLAHRPDDLDMLQLGAMTTPWPTRRLEYAEALVKLKPDAIDFHVFRARALIEANKAREALDAVELALKLDPKSDIALTTRGYAHSALGDHAQAVRDHETVARRQPGNAEARVDLASAYTAAQRFTDAQDAATQALGLQPRHAGALELRASARLAMGDAEGALADLDSAERADPDGVGEYDATRKAARRLIAVRDAMRPESLAALEADRQLVLGTVRSYLVQTCGEYSVRPYEDNEGLSAYRKCIIAWYKNEDADEAFASNLSPQVVAAGERFTAKVELLEGAETYGCAKMPKKSRCIDDGAFVRLNALAAGMADPKDIVGAAEYERLNREVHAYNAQVKRTNAFVKTANFLQALADELSAQ